MRDRPLRIVALGCIVRWPLGAMVWHHLQFVLGLRALGHDVVFLEDSGELRPGCYNPEANQMVDFPTYGLAWVTDLFETVGIGDRWAYYDAHGTGWHGPTAATAESWAADADIVLNLSGVNPLRSWYDRVPVRVLVDTDPSFTQIKHLENPQRLSAAREHNRFYSWGLNIDAGSQVPDDGLPWRPIRQPIVLDLWDTTAPPVGARYNTVMAWNSYPALEFNGVRYGMKSDSFGQVTTLPRHVDVGLELALGGGGAARALLAEEGWHVTDSLAKTRDAWTFQEYVHESRGEFTVAKQGYVTSRCGWFSDKSACYLASGRPVITEETGFSSHLPVGKGLLSFSDLDGAIAAIETVESAYEEHARAAREIAERYFDAKIVLRELLDGL